MKKLILLKSSTCTCLKLKKELESIHGRVTVHEIEHGRDAEIHVTEKPALFIYRTETDSDDLLGDALKMASDNGLPILFILSRPEECSYDRISSMEMAWYIKEPYTINELKSRIKEATSSSKLCEWNHQLLNNSTKDVNFSMGSTGKIFYVSSSVEKLSGFTPEEVMDKDLKELVTEETFSFISGLIGTFCSKLKTGEPVTSPVFDMEIIHKDGSTAWVELSINPVFDEDKKFKYFTGTMHDVTERKLTEERFRIAAECTNDQIYEWDMKTDCLRWFSDIDKGLSYEEGEIPQTLEGWSERVHPDDLPGVTERIEKYKKSGGLFEAEYRMITKNGDIRYWKEHGIPVIDDVTKEIVRTIGVCSDITEQVETEKILKERDEMFRLIAEKANDVIWVLNTNAEVVYVSPSVEKLRGYTPEELAGLPIEERFTPDSSKLINNMWMSFFKDFRKGALPALPQMIEVEQPCKDGSTVWSELHINPVLDEEGNLRFFLGISRDINERKKVALELEKQAQVLDSIFDLAPTPMLLINRDETVDKINQACMEITGFSKTKAIGKKPGNLLSCVNANKGGGCGTNKDCMSCAIYNAELGTFSTKNNLDKKEGHVTVQLPDGSCKQINILISTAYVDLYGSEDAKVIVTIEDITERKDAEAVLILSMIKAEEANRTKSEFLATMSHELRTPLNAIMGYSQMLQDGSFGELNPKQRKFASHTYASGKHLLNLINDILDLSKVEAGKMELHYEGVYVNDVMKDVYNIIAPLADKKHIDIDFLISEEIMIYADKIRLKQILYNLINNAIKFTPDDGNVSIKVETYNGDMKVSVNDTGIGMSEQEQKKLFTPFYQADSSTSRKYQGTGLGLSIVKKMIEHHGGTIEVESEAGKGSTFTFTIPVKRMN